ncbi:NlpC/P60 family protein [Flavobacterium sp. CF108]|uniref:C40 family peptidase n=1 Tax=unclassified Flavobacterium TaxID=196869 RepID=UPI0008D75BFC|nr:MULTISPECIES: NlpC/P60 family protein [unclassified Flavobacterium]SEO84732.1 NlpC/P60 family protein [Flavobacterium sp. fv08]SHG70554.1 NlpC/P60 family protein [Flavobacterium sp. CF108]
MKQLFVVLFIIICFGCSSKKYIAQIPFKYDYSLDLLKKQAEMEETGLKNKTIVNDNSENLSDEVLYLKEKYSIVLAVMPSKIRNYKLYSYFDPWINTPYKEKSFSKTGIDCSYFLQSLYSDVYKVTLPKDPAGMWKSKSIQVFTGRTFLTEGDLVFFRYDKDHPISDVALYLHNDRILACTDKGLGIYNFNDEYFQLRYIGAGRINEDTRKK